MKEKVIVLKKGFMCFLFVWILSIRCVTSQIICPKVFEGGSIDDSCSREYRAICFQYKCNPGYVASISYLTCGESGRWVNPYGKSLKCTREDFVEEKLGHKVCPDRFNGGYVSWYCNRIPRQTCAYKCNTGYLVNSTITQLTCKENGLWDADTNSLCIESGESTSSSFFVPTSTGGGCEVLALGISLGIGIPMLIIAIIVGCVRWCRIRKARRVPNQTDSRYFRSREYPGQHDTNTRQYPASSSVDGVSPFEFATYDRQHISTISSSLKYPEPPPLYSEIQISPNESPPAYKEVVKDPSRFSLHIELAMFNGQR
ncbi:hypothetical protein CHS0354_005367 [Potamilus streckersoni]|uniref:Sushi domain-containing protein n=1 Tax=Potamilus streckersoni TaxID=2493646 RepID=A0AAE0VXN6_9BIVA|nr:hypothetical protein CHS0354_005367 [Potamilus streckersoni]